VQDFLSKCSTFCPTLAAKRLYSVFELEPLTDAWMRIRFWGLVVKMCLYCSWL
jgi:hypothetical protein